MTPQPTRPQRSCDSFDPWVMVSHCEWKHQSSNPDCESVHCWPKICESCDFHHRIRSNPPPVSGQRAGIVSVHRRPGGMSDVFKKKICYRKCSLKLIHPNTLIYLIQILRFRSKHVDEKCLGSLEEHPSSHDQKRWSISLTASLHFT